MNLTLNRIAAAVCCALLVLSAQAPAAPLGQLNPGRVEVPDRSGSRSSPTQMPGTLELPQTEVVPQDVAPPAEMTALPANQSRFKVTEVTLLGVASYPAATFEPLLARLRGHEVNLAEIYAVADAITQRYRQAGFLLAKAYVPEQRLQGGRLTLQVFEGKVNQVTFSGPANQALERYADNIRQQQPPTSANLERNLLLMNDLSGNDSRAVLQASPVQAGTDLAVENSLRKYEGFVGFDNRDSRYFGPWQMYGGFGINDLSGRGDHLGIRAGKSIEGNKMTFFEGQYELPVGS